MLKNKKKFREDVPTLSVLVNTVLDELKGIIVGKKITESSMIIVCVAAMKIVDQVPKLTGPDKKQIVLLVLKKLVSQGDNQAVLLNVINNVMPVAIDTLISVDKKKIRLHVRKVFNCCIKKL